MSKQYFKKFGTGAWQSFQGVEITDDFADAYKFIVYGTDGRHDSREDHQEQRHANTIACMLDTITGDNWHVEESLSCYLICKSDGQL